MIERDLTDTSFDSNGASAWLEDVLKESFAQRGESKVEFSPPSEAFRQRCQDAADVAVSVARLRNERRRIGFVPVSLAEYVQGLIKVTGAQAEAVLARFDLVDIDRLTSDSVRGLTRFAQRLGISLREILIHVRIGFLEKIDSVPVPLLLAHHRTAGPRDQLAECESVLALAEGKYEGELLNELRRAEFEIRTAYKQGEKL
jgi:hypothetical protein